MAEAAPDADGAVFEGDGLADREPDDDGDADGEPDCEGDADVEGDADFDGVTDPDGVGDAELDVLGLALGRGAPGELPEGEEEGVDFVGDDEGELVGDEDGDEDGDGEPVGDGELVAVDGIAWHCVSVAAAVFAAAASGAACAVPSPPMTRKLPVSKLPAAVRTYAKRIGIALSTLLRSPVCCLCVRKRTPLLISPVSHYICVTEAPIATRWTCVP